MSKLILTFKLPEERSEANCAVAAGKMYSICWEISQYARTLRKYDERENIPTEEVVDKLHELLEDFFTIECE